VAKRIFFIVGEASGDMHCANLAKQLLSIDTTLQLSGWGGDRMTAEGVTVQKHIRELAFMGFWEVFKNIKTIAKNFKVCQEQIQAYQPDVLILVDYPGFNLRMAKWAKMNGFRVFYYVSPQVWAWKKNRVKIIEDCVDQLYCILPFEKNFYASLGMNVHYLGHPLLDEIQHFKLEDEVDFKGKKKILAILPGSRKQEIQRKLPIMLEAARHFSDYEIIVAGAPNLEKGYYERFMKGGERLIHGKTYHILKQANLALVTSGTATLETALFRVPQVVCYKSSYLSYWIARMLVNIKFISLVNLILDKEAVKELIQGSCNVQMMVDELQKIEVDKPNRNKMLKDYDVLIESLGSNGASERIAVSMMNYLNG
jgi:lipid-A-disaccharide synthase